ncbi:hypothetical protein DPMN_027956 [Dreissena polymorpha]|uniref:Uncharacterized protein n=1 Tax=Dreissena polymorpha TaxID=45954 RepID=A0A9D4LUH5_DREPO|nr:hypothetical protein DPMN_027956 [Dreissena polymorpha]
MYKTTKPYSEWRSMAFLLAIVYLFLSVKPVAAIGMLKRVCQASVHQIDDTINEHARLFRVRSALVCKWTESLFYDAIVHLFWKNGPTDRVFGYRLTSFRKSYQFKVGEERDCLWISSCWKFVTKSKWWESIPNPSSHIVCNRCFLVEWLCGNRILKAFENSLDPDETPQNVAIMKLHRYIDHDSQMTPIDFEVTSSYMYFFTNMTLIYKQEQTTWESIPNPSSHIVCNRCFLVEWLDECSLAIFLSPAVRMSTL